MLPLAVLLHKMGAHVAGSDRSYDQGKTPEKFKALLDIGISLTPQDGSGLHDGYDYLVVSTAIEDSIPDVRAAKKYAIEIIKRGQLLANLFNEADDRIAIAGTSGKSTVTGMVGTILSSLDLDPTVVNGGIVRNFIQGNEPKVFSSIRLGKGKAFVAEMDESDGSIAHYNPSIAALNNIALDHMSMEELEALFGDYISRASRAVIANFDDGRVKQLCEQHNKVELISFSQTVNADLYAYDITPQVDGIKFTVAFKGGEHPVQLHVPGRHNVSNALCALASCVALGLDMNSCAQALSNFRGIHRRMELIAQKNDVTIYDDFGHNPDKIAASLCCLKEFDGRVIVMFQPHGFGPLRLMGEEMIDSFAKHLNSDDILIMPEVYYAGGTVDRSVTANDIIQRAKQRGLNAHWFENRAATMPFILDHARSGDRIVIMGARDDTLHDFAKTIADNIT